MISITNIRDNQLFTWIQQSKETVAEVFSHDRIGQIGVVILLVFIFMALFAPALATHDPQERNHDDQGGVKSLESPSSEHYMGTTNQGRDVFSQLVFGSRTALLVGVIAAFVSVSLGTTIGIVSGYYGGYVDDVLMRLTDLAYGIPFLPMVIALVFLLGASLQNLIIAIVFIMWRASARVIRSQTLTIKERPYVESARASGAGNRRIMVLHILPQVLPLTFLYMSLAVAWAILTEANVSFLGFGDPLRISWGTMIFEAFISNVLREAWWWVLPPGISIMLLVMSVFFIGRALEEAINPNIQAKE